LSESVRELILEVRVPGEELEDNHRGSSTNENEGDEDRRFIFAKRLI